VVVPPEAGIIAEEAEHVGPGAPIAVAGIAAAVATRDEEKVEFATEEGAVATAVTEVETALPQVNTSEAVAADAEAALSQVEVGAPEVESVAPGGAAILAGAGVAAVAAIAHEEKAEVGAKEVAAAAGEAEAALPQLEVSAPEVEARGPGLGAVVAGAGVAAAVAIAHEEKADVGSEEVATAAGEAEAAPPQVEVSEPTVEKEGAGLGAALTGIGVAAVVSTAAGHEEAAPEPAQIPESAPEPEPGEPVVEILEEELPPTADETGRQGVGDALAAAGLAAVVHEGETQPEQEAVTMESVVLEPDSSELQGETQTDLEVAAPAVAAAAAPVRRVAWAYDEGTAKVAKASGVLSTQGIGQVYAGKLKEIGITTTAALLRAGSTPKGRKELAEKTGISPKQILKWVNHVDLARIKGISEQYADLLEWAGVDTVPALAQRNADNLLQKLTEVNEARRLVRRLPTLGMVASWIAQAKELPRVVVYK
jgi:predicted flap endonuclease-1-like 5' DNA nuclease